MSEAVVDLQRQSTDLEALLDMLESQHEILITRFDIPVARLSAVDTTPTPETITRIPGLNSHAPSWISDDFDDPLPFKGWHD